MTCQTLGSVSGLNQAVICSTLAVTLRWRSTAPFDMPVVPPVYCRNAISSPETVTVGFGKVGAELRAAEKLTACLISKGGTDFFR